MKKLVLVLIIGWVEFIFFQGSREPDESFYRSDAVVDNIVNLVHQFGEWFEDEQSPISNEQKPVVEDKPLGLSAEELFSQKVSFLVRKGAHFFEYGVLSIILGIYFYLFKHHWYNQMIYSLFIVLLTAVLDEFYQSFIGRTSSVLDVIIDFSGAIFGVLAVQLIYFYLSRQKVN